jgi:hypothetical protein
MKYVEMKKGFGKDVMYIVGILTKEEINQYKKEGYRRCDSEVSKNGILKVG